MEDQTALVPMGASVRITEVALKEMQEQRTMFQSFVKSQLKDQVDFGVLPGTEKPSLWKPGAEKIANIFQLGSRIVKSDRVIEIGADKNFAMFAITIEIYHLASGKAIAQCEGICNSQEKKYRERSVYEWSPKERKKVFVRMEATPVGDIMNTLNKMAQKRAFVGAVIIATKASDFFNHDLAEDDEEFFENNPDFHANQQKVQDAEKNRIQEKKNAPAPQAKATEGSFDQFAGGGFKIPPKEPVLDPTEAIKKQYLKEVGLERVRLQWMPAKMAAYIKENFQKEPDTLSNDDLEILVKALKKTEKK